MFITLVETIATVVACVLFTQEMVVFWWQWFNYTVSAVLVCSYSIVAAPAVATVSVRTDTVVCMVVVTGVSSTQVAPKADRSTSVIIEVH